MRLALTSLLCLTLICRSRADPHPPPTGITSEWLDRFTVMVSWNRADVVNNGQKILFRVNTPHKHVKCFGLNRASVRESLLTEEMVADHWECTIRTANICSNHPMSIPATFKIFPSKPGAELVKDFECFFQDTKVLNCSWIPVNATQNLTVSYRHLGVSDEVIKSLKTCTQPYSIGKRKGCIVHADPQEALILVETDTAISTFKPHLVLSPPKLSITAEQDELSLSLTPLISPQCWTYNVCYKECNKSKGCREPGVGVNTLKVPRDDSCLYEFSARIMSRVCFQTKIVSRYSDPVFYGGNKNGLRTFTVMAIVIPLILSICVILSCYCFRKHSAILCPVIPDPSVMFKSMMSGNKEHESISGGLYTPVPENIERCKIIVVSENRETKENP